MPEEGESRSFLIMDENQIRMQLIDDEKRSAVMFDSARDFRIDAI